jgi:riboflavin biosynthesis pyrimidine reductase
MGSKVDPSPLPPGAGPPAAPPVFRRLLPPGDPASTEEIVQDLRIGDRAARGSGRPYVMLNMVSTIDGRVTIAGRSGSLGNRADGALFHGLRGAVDAVMAGAGTVKAERYGRIIREQSQRELRVQRGLTTEPIACVVSGRLSLPEGIPLLAEPAAHVVILTASQATLPASGARIEYVRAGREGTVDLPAALAELHDRFGVRTLLCEGGPHLNSRLLEAGLVDELFLSLSAKLAGEQKDGLAPLRVVAGADFDPPVELALLGARESDSQLFLSYGVRASAAERVS